MKKLATALIVLALCAFVLVGCKKEAAKDEGLNILIISSTGVDDGSFNQNNYEGIQAFLKNHPGKVTDVKEPDYAKLIPRVDELSGEYDVFVLPGFNFAGVGDIVKANPDKHFIVVDSTVTDAAGNAVNAAEVGNLYTMTFAENESAFPCGVAAALASKTGKVAVVNGIAYPSNVNYQYGFMAGVAYANHHYGTKVECIELPSYAGTDVLGNIVGGNYTGDFGAVATGKVIGEALIAQGVDVILAACGDAGNGVFAAVKEAKDVMVIGCDVDQFNDGVVGDKNIVLTSTLKLMAGNVEKQLTAIAEGTFKAEDAFLKASNEGVGFVSAEGRQQLTAEQLKQVQDAFELVKTGKISVPNDCTQGGSYPADFSNL